MRAGFGDFLIFSQPVLCQATRAAFREHLKVRVFSFFVQGCCCPCLAGRAAVAARRLTELVGLLLLDVQGIKCLAASDLTLLIGRKDTSSRLKKMQSLAAELSHRYHWMVVSLPVFQETYEHFCLGLNSRFIFAGIEDSFQRPSTAERHEFRVYCNVWLHYNPCTLPAARESKLHVLVCLSTIAEAYPDKLCRVFFPAQVSCSDLFWRQSECLVFHLIWFTFLKMTIEIVDFPIKTGGSCHSSGDVYQAGYKSVLFLSNLPVKRFNAQLQIWLERSYCQDRDTLKRYVDEGAT